MNLDSRLGPWDFLSLVRQWLGRCLYCGGKLNPVSSTTDPRNVACSACLDGKWPGTTCSCCGRRTHKPGDSLCRKCVQEMNSR